MTKHRAFGPLDLFPATLPETLFPPLRGDDGAAPEIAFDPVPRLRRRRGGWSEERQRGFIAALALCGSVASAARSVGMTARGAYRLLDADGADSFAAAWDEAVEAGTSRVRLQALDRALHGDLVPVYRRGRLVRVEHRFSDRLAIALLSGRDKSVEDYRRSAVSARRYRQDMKALDARRAEKQRQADAVWAEHQAILDRLAKERRPRPRVRSL